ncbi:hypothetical protein [Rudanella lutea]|uniref:hypothetical protein n=1 Tax=Rudanella lutea TaxID=451374 RepID=UPI0012F7E53F|nr:hypothetical protein [Rudanella lutea]
MKKYIIISCVALTLSSCGITEQENVSSDRFSSGITSNKPLVADAIPLNLPGVNPSNSKLSAAQMKVAALENEALQEHLSEIATIPIPLENSQPAISVEEAHKRYTAFLDQHKGDKVIPLFQQRYARVMLNQYNLLNQTDYDLIYYYVDQLRMSKTLDFSTLAKGLSKLNGHIDQTRLEQETRLVLHDAEQRLVSNQKAIAAIKNSLQNRKEIRVNGDFKKDFIVGIMEHEISRLENSTLPEDISKLKQILTKL